MKDFLSFMTPVMLVSGLVIFGLHKAGLDWDVAISLTSIAISTLAILLRPR